MSTRTLAIWTATAATAAFVLSHHQRRRRELAQAAPHGHQGQHRTRARRRHDGRR